MNFTASGEDDRSRNSEGLGARGGWRLAITRDGRAKDTDVPNQTPDGDQFDEFAPRDQGFSLLRTPKQTLAWYLRAAPFDLRRHDDARSLDGSTIKIEPATRPRGRHRDGVVPTLLRGLLLIGLAIITVSILLLGLLLAGLAIITVGAELSSLTSGHGIVRLSTSGYFEPFLHVRAPGVGWHQHVGSYQWYWTCIVVTLLATISAVVRVVRVLTSRRYRRRRWRVTHSPTWDSELAQAKARFDNDMAAPPKRVPR